MEVLINIPEERFADIQRIASVQVERRVPSVEQIIANGTPTIEPVRKGRKINQHSYPAKWLCSECGAKHFDFGDKFCSKCGANVEEGD